MTTTKKVARRSLIIDRLLELGQMDWLDLYNTFPEMHGSYSLVSFKKTLCSMAQDGVLSKDGSIFSLSKSFFSKNAADLSQHKNVGIVATPRTGNVFGSVMTGYAANMLRAAQTRENSLHRYHVTPSGVSVIANPQGVA